MMTVVVSAVLLFSITGSLFAADGDLIVNGNLGVGTSTPQGKAEVNGNMIVDGDTTTKGNATTNGNTIVNGNLGVGTATPTEKAEVNGNLKVNGNLCVGDKCTSSLHVSGGLYGLCQFLGSTVTYSPAYRDSYGGCACPAGYTRVTTYLNGFASIYSCYKN